jgi:hypothetical protein
MTEEGDPAYRVALRRRKTGPSWSRAAVDPEGWVPTVTEVTKRFFDGSEAHKTVLISLYFRLILT